MAEILPPFPTRDMCHSASPTAYMAQILRSSSTPTGNMCQCISYSGYMPQILFSSQPLTGTCVSECPPPRTLLCRDMCPLASFCVYMAQILLPPPTLGTCFTEHLPLHIWLRSSSPPSIPTKDLNQ